MALALINPSAGGGRARDRAGPALEALRAAGLELEVIHTEHPGHATELAASAWRAGERRFIAGGGDGTAWEVLNGVLPAALESGEVPWLGFLALGTGNSFLKDFGEGDLAHSLDALRAGRTQRVDVLGLTHAEGTTYFINLLSMGFAAEVALLTNRRLKPLGAAGYSVGVVLRTATLSPAPLPYALDGGPLHEGPVTMLNFCNSRYTGGAMLMAPDADPTDGRLDVIHAGPMTRLGLLSTFPKLFKGTHLEHPALHAVQARAVRFALDGPVPVVVDGESMLLRPERIALLPGALDVCA